MELLGKPTDTSITINIVPASAIEYYYRYGKATGDYDWQTANVTATGGQPSEVTITGLDPAYALLLPDGLRWGWGC